MRIAIIGTGIAGLTAAYRLHKDFDIDVFEAGDYAGGHTNTVEVELDGRPYAVDTGFIVFNDRTYPHFMQLLHELGVDYQPSDMSFSVQSERTGLEYCGSSLNTVFAQRRNLLNPRFHRMLIDILRFNRLAVAFLMDNPDNNLTLGDFLRRHHMSERFISHYLVPMGAAIWSMQPAKMLDFPAVSFIRFFHNHGLLSLSDRPTWFTVSGGARQYVRTITARFADRLHLNRPVRQVLRDRLGVTVIDAAGHAARYDQVVLAVHSDQALAMLADPSGHEREILGAIRYQPNEAVLHTDRRLLPANPRAWASWNYFLGRTDSRQPRLTYHMNRLQNIDSPRPLCVTLNHGEAIDPDTILYRRRYDHPLYTLETVRAQARWYEISGLQRTHYCGAYWFNGFHEDGVRSALRVCDRLMQARRPYPAHPGKAA